MAVRSDCGCAAPSCLLCEHLVVQHSYGLHPTRMQVGCHVAMLPCCDAHKLLHWQNKALGVSHAEVNQASGLKPMHQGCKLHISRIIDQEHCESGMCWT